MAFVSFRHGEDNNDAYMFVCLSLGFQYSMECSLLLCGDFHENHSYPLLDKELSKIVRIRQIYLIRSDTGVDERLQYKSVVGIACAIVDSSDGSACANS